MTNESSFKKLISSRTNITLLIVAVLIIFFGAYVLTGAFVAKDPNGGGIPASEITTFTDSGNEIETIDGKPVIRLFSTTWCSHCKWISETYESVVQEYVDDGKIVAYHWELDINDDALTPALEGTIPESELAVYREFNPRGSIPTFVFGNRFYRVGNGHESANDLAAEEAEFRAVIDKLIEEAA